MTFEDLRRLMQEPRDWNGPGPGELAAVTAPQPNAVAIEALRLMRDTTQSRQQYDRAVEALKQMGVKDE